MSPLEVEVFNSTSKNWVRVSSVLPEDPPGSVSDNKPDGGRDVYMFKCEGDDSKSTRYRSKFGVDTEWGRFREIDTTGFEVVKELKKGESFELSLKTDVSAIPRRVRFTQK